MPQFAAGSRVTHAHYGDGTVTEANEYHTRIDFDAHGLRTFSSPRVSLEPSTSAAPVRAAAKRTRKAPAKAAKAVVAAAEEKPVVQE